MSKKIVVILIAGLFSLLLFNTTVNAQESIVEKIIRAIDATEIARAKGYLVTVPITITHAYSERSAGRIHDFYSEGDYWWPNPEDPKGPLRHPIIWISK